MSFIVTDAGFRRADPVKAVTLAQIADHKSTLDLAHTDTPEAARPYLADLHLIRISFPAFNDGRAFTIARRLRVMGYTGILRAVGPVIADQYAMLRRVGFDEVEIPDDLALRQPESQWIFRADWREHDYLARLKA